MTDRFFETDEPLMRSVLEWAYERIVNGQDPHAGAKSVEVLEAELGGSISADGIGGDEALRRFTETVVSATRALGHHMNLAYVPSAPTPASLTFDLAVSAAEIFAGTWEAGAGAIHAENQALDWLAGLAGFPSTAGGTFVQGGTVGNLSALAVARERARAEFGVTTGRWAIAATSEAHSSIRSAARVLDVEIVGVDGDERGRMTGPALAAALDSAPDVTVFAVVATGGTTNAGIVDDLAGIAAICDKRQLWMHVDGAYGLAGLAAPSVRDRFDGIERADSFVVDPHKWLFAPYDCCALVYSDPGWAHAAHAQHAEYLEQIDRTEWNPSDYAIQLTRRARGLPFWFSLATYGTDRYAEAVERGLRTARDIADGIRAADHLELVLEPDLSVVLFRRIGWTADQMLEWSSQGRVAGSILVLPTRWQGESVFRICIVSPDTRAADVLDALATMR
jgi:glutamate/tyrosine decarboxylase-like PLP-dependent enzyme